VTDAASAIIPVKWQTTVVTDIVVRTATVKSFILAPSQPFTFRAGQHVDVRLTAPDGYRAMRSYSIASAPESVPAIELAIERLADGEVSPFFHDVAAVGDAIELRGPLGGYFVWPMDDGRPLLLAAGGSGVAPLMAMVRHRAAAADQRPVTLLYSARTWEDVIFRDELLELDDRRDGFELRLILTREMPRRARDYGRRIDSSMISEVLARLPGSPRVLVCGSNSFVNAAADGAVEASVPAAEVLTERYGV
jgi:ferredoxin-NADP reductase